MHVRKMDLKVSGGTTCGVADKLARVATATRPLASMGMGLVNYSYRYSFLG